MTGAELFARLMEAAGITHSFGVLGGTALDIVQHIYQRSSGRFIPVRHEQVAASAADAFGRTSGRPAVCFGVVTAGATNLLTGVAIAYRDSAPLIVVTANEELRRSHRDIWQGMDVVPLFSPITKWSRRVLRVAEIPYYFRIALLQATSGRPGPVHLDLPMEIGPAAVDSATEREAEQVMRWLEANPARVPAERPGPNGDEVRAAAALLSAAERPTIAVGGGVIWSEACEDLLKLAERLSALVVLSSTARGALPEDHPLCLGATGRHGNPVADRALQDADVVLAVGSRLSDLHTRGWTLISPPAQIIQNDIEPAEIGRSYPVDVRLTGDARLTLTALNAALASRGATGSMPAQSRARRYRQLRAAEWQEFVASDDSGPLKPQAIVREVRGLLPRSAIAVHGAGLHTTFGSRLPAYEPRTHLKAIESAAMSFAFPASLGAQLAAPDREVVVLVGDGDFMMTVQDFETAVRERIPVIVVVFNNFALRAEYLVAGQIDESIKGCAHSNPDFGKLAELFGGGGGTAQRLDEFVSTFQRLQAFTRETGLPAILDAQIDPSELPRWMRSPYQEPAMA